jgi:hypothetical protein
VGECVIRTSRAPAGGRAERRPGSECTEHPYAEAEAGSGWMHVPSQQTAERYRVRLLKITADSADVAVLETFRTRALVCSYRIRRSDPRWAFEQLDPPCAAGDRTRARGHHQGAHDGQTTP